MHHFIKLCFLVLLCREFRQVMSSTCEFSEVKNCNANIRDLPYHGENEAHFNETCEMLHTAVNCVADFESRCVGNSACDQQCELGVDAVKKSGFEKLYAELCTVDGELRQQYLKYYACFNTAANEYDNCHKLSAESHKHINGSYTQTVKCCLFSWYQDCLIQASNVTCGDEAALATESLLDIALDHILSNCEEASCLKPPLPDETKSPLVEGTEGQESELHPTEKVEPNTTGASGILVAGNVYYLMRHFLILLLMFNFVIYY